MLGKLLLLTVLLSTATAMIKLKYDVTSFNITQVLGANKDVTVELNFTVSKRQGKLTPAIYMSSIAGNYPPSSVQSDLVKFITDDAWAWIAVFLYLSRFPKLEVQMPKISPTLSLWSSTGLLLTLPLF